MVTMYRDGKGIMKMSNSQLDERGVYKFGAAGRTFYRLGMSLAGARKSLAGELKMKVTEVEVLDKGNKQ